MPEGIQSLGLTGLTKNVDKRTAAKEDLATMGKLVDLKKEKEKEEQQAALMEQKYYEQIRLEADKMLTGDRAKINEKAKGLQSQIRQQIRAFGGSRAKFMANGGLAMIGDYANNLLGSEEVSQYKENKTNLEQLLDIKKKGMGHLISSRDEQSIQEYYKNGYGPISYSGLMNEVEIPDAKKFAWGTWSTPAEILGHSKNYTKILGNYIIDHPGFDPESVSTEELTKVLLSYTDAKGWGVQGTDKTAFSNKRDSSGRKVNPKTGRPIRNVSGELYLSYKHFNNNVKLEDMNKRYLPDQDYLRDVFGDHQYKGRSRVNSTIGNKVGHAASWGTGIGLGLQLTGAWTWDKDNTFVPRNADDFGATMQMPLFKTQNTDKYVVDEYGKIKDVNPMDLKNLYLGNGTPVKDKSKMNKGDYEVVGAFGGYEMMAQGRSYLVMDAIDEDTGRLDERNKDMYVTEEGAEDPEGRRAIFIALKDDDNNIFYQKIDYDGSAHASNLNQHMKDFDDLSDQYEENEGNAENLKEMTLKAQVARDSKANLEVTHEIFDDNRNFRAQVENYNNYNQGSNQRSNLMKSFYMTVFDINTTGEGAPGYDMDKAINENEFETWMERWGVKKALKDPDLSDADILEIVRETLVSPAHSEDNDGMKLINLTLYNKWKNYLSKSYKNG